LAGTRFAPAGTPPAARHLRGVPDQRRPARVLGVPTVEAGHPARGPGRLLAQVGHRPLRAGGPRGPWPQARAGGRPPGVHPPRDLPYDQFVMSQVAGDLLPAPEPGGINVEGTIATGMLAIGNWGGGDADKEKLLTDIADDQVDVVSRAFLGLTVACARCHDHKFDPIPTDDYYSLAGIFFSSHILQDPGPKTNGPPMLRIPLVPKAQFERHR